MPMEGHQIIEAYGLLVAETSFAEVRVDHAPLHSSIRYGRIRNRFCGTRRKQQCYDECADHRIKLKR